MRALIQIMFLLSLISGIPAMTIASAPFSKSIDIKRKLSFTGDTSSINRYSRLALTYAAKKADIKYIKANIDTAELICKSENVEMPALLHLARAQYFYIVEDFNNASQESTIAMNISKNNDFSWQL